MVTKLLHYFFTFLAHSAWPEKWPHKCSTFMFGKKDFFFFMGEWMRWLDKSWDKKNDTFLHELSLGFCISKNHSEIRDAIFMDKKF